jgi:hypothetical protein
MDLVPISVLFRVVLIKMNVVSEENQEKLVFFAQEKYSLWLNCRHAVKIIKSTVSQRFVNIIVQRFKVFVATHCNIVVLAFWNSS